MSLDALTSLIETATPLTETQAAEAMRLIADGEAETGQITRFLRAFNQRTPTVEELMAFVTVLRGRMTRVHAPADNTICNCGTGGDGRGTINVSTIAAFMIAACGVPVAKHGNRSVSSRCGSTDCLTALGIRPSANPRQAEDLLDTDGLCFLNAPDFHPALRHAAEARAKLAADGQKSVFNILGPMLNPAGILRQSMGVFSEDIVQPIAETLVKTGTIFGYVVWGDGYDELTLTGPTRMATIRDGVVSMGTFEPKSLGLTRCDHRDLIGGDPPENARSAEAILSGQQSGPAADMVLLNAAAGISAGSQPHVDLGAGLTLAREAVTCGTALEKLNAMRRKTPAHV